METVCAGIVTYNPDIELLKENIDSIIDQVAMLIVVDNGSENSKQLSDFLNDYEVIFVKNTTNKGIARALNQVCDIAIKKSYNWIITLDQDSISPNNLVKELHAHVDRETAIIAPNIVYKNNEKFVDNSLLGKQETDWVITSASLTNLHVWKQVGGFDEKLFIDGVDKDYCIRVHRIGYKVYKDYDITLLHELGKLHCISVCGRIVFVTNHSALRKYYMARNAVYLDRKLSINDSRNYITKLILKTLIFENNRFAKIYQIFVGIKDGKRMIKKK